jgi:hypothetical protein
MTKDEKIGPKLFFQISSLTSESPRELAEKALLAVLELLQISAALISTADRCLKKSCCLFVASTFYFEGGKSNISI